MSHSVLGIALSDISTSLIFYPNEEGINFPTVIGKQKGEDKWVVGEEAYGLALGSNGVITDKLLKLTRKGGYATIDGVRYSGRDILKLFFREIIDFGKNKLMIEEVEHVVIAITELDNAIIKELRTLFTELGYVPENVHVISKEESFIYFVLSLPKEYWGNRVGLFDLSDASLTYYEMATQKDNKKIFVNAESEKMNEAFNLQILNTTSGAKLADRILTSAATKVMGRSRYSTIFLTGDAFTSVNWAPDFTDYLCGRGRVFADLNLFAKGAAFRGVDMSSKESIYNITCTCEGRLKVDVWVNVINNGSEKKIVLGKLGDFWNEQTMEMVLIPENTDKIDIFISSYGQKEEKMLSIPLDFLPDRPQKTRKINFKSRFNDNKTLSIEMNDEGFGDMYPATDKRASFEVNIWD